MVRSLSLALLSLLLAPAASAQEEAEGAPPDELAAPDDAAPVDDADTDESPTDDGAESDAVPAGDPEPRADPAGDNEGGDAPPPPAPVDDQRTTDSSDDGQDEEDDYYRRDRKSDGEDDAYGDDGYGDDDDGDRDARGDDRRDPGGDDRRDRGGDDATDDGQKPDTEGGDPLVAGGAAYGAGAASMGSLLLLQLVMSAASVTGAFVPGLGAVIGPANIILNLMSFLLCCGLPALEGAAITATGDFLIGADPGMAYLWTILASYGACWGGGCLLGLAQVGLGTVLVGPTYALSQVNVNGVPLATLSPTQTGIAAAMLISTTAVFVAAQPAIPAAVWYLTAKSPSADDDLPNLPRNRRAELDAPIVRATTVAMAF